MPTTLAPLAKARELALANRMLARSGGDLLSEKSRAEGVPTFTEAAERVLEQKRGGWRGRWHAQNWWRSMERYAFPRIGNRPVSEVNTADVLDILTPIWHVKAETARAVRQRIRSVLEWAIALDMRNDNRCDRVLPVLGPQNDIVTHRQALPHRDVAEAIETVRVGSAQPAVKLAFEFLVLTPTRSARYAAHNGLSEVAPELRSGRIRNNAASDRPRHLPTLNTNQVSACGKCLRRSWRSGKVSRMWRDDRPS